MGVFVAHADLTDPTLSFDGGKSHGGSTVCGFLWAHTDSTRFNKIQQEDYLWEFVLIRGRKKNLFNPLKIKIH